MGSFPDAEYLVIASRLVPDVDGGFTIATLARARQMAAAGVGHGLGPTLLTIDVGTPEGHAHHRSEFVRRGQLPRPDLLRNLYDDVVGPHGGAAEWLRAAAHPGGPDPALTYRDIPAGPEGKALGLPVLPGQTDWHISSAPIAVYDQAGRCVGVLHGFGELYRTWLAHIISERRAAGSTKDVVVVCESRQLGELLAAWDRPDVRVVHTVHTTHLQEPYTPDAPVGDLWERWFRVADLFDAVLWPTAAQRDEAAERFGLHGVHIVAPHAVAKPVPLAPPPQRTPGLAVMLTRLSPGKRVDHAIRAFRTVADRVPGARLEIYGVGDQWTALAALIEELALGDTVVLRGGVSHPTAVLDSAQLLLSTSAYEGQGLAIAESLVHGCPVVAYDVRYGPRDALAAGGGILVEDGDIDALAAAIIAVLGDEDMHERLAQEAVDSTAVYDATDAMMVLRDAVTIALSQPSRRQQKRPART